MPEKNRFASTLEQRIEVIRKSENDRLSANNLFGVGRTQIDGILKRKLYILADFENNVPSARKRQKKATGNGCAWP